MNGSNDVFNGNVTVGIRVKVNGSTVARTFPTGTLTRDALKTIAQEHGLKSYSAWLDNRKLTTSELASPLVGEELRVEAIHTKGARS